MLEGLMQCISQLELLFHIQNLHSVLEEAAAILFFAQRGPGTQHDHHFVTDFQCSGKISPHIIGSLSFTVQR